MTPGGSACHLGLYGPSSSIAIGHECGLVVFQILFLWFLVAIWAMDINTDSGRTRTMDPDMFPRTSLGPDAIMTLAGISCHPD